MDVGVDNTTDCDVTKCVPSLPDGFTVVTVSSGSSSCPSGWTSNAVVSAPTAGDGTCTCMCDITTAPTCNTGTLDRYLDVSSTATCTTQGTTLYPNGTPCQQLVQPIELLGYHYSVDAVAPTGGACSYNTTTDNTKITTTAGQVCTPPASCVGAACGGNVCVSKTGDVDCPMGFPAKTLVGPSATATCSDCNMGGASCSVDATCSGTLDLYTDTGCTMNQVSFPADGTCNANTGMLDGYYYSFSYTGTVSSAACSGTPPTSTATVSLASPTTVCCKQ